MSCKSCILVPVVLLCIGALSCARTDKPIVPNISQEALYRDWREFLDIGSPTFFGVEGPLEHPHAWISPRVLAPGPNGSVIVLEDSTPDVKVLFPDGRVLALGNGTGSGPGEFRDLFGAAWSEDLGILIADGPNRRITQFNEEGSYLGDIHPSISHYRLAASGRHLWTTSFPPISDQAYLLDTESGEVLREVGGRYISEPWAENRNIQGSIAAQEDYLLVAVSYPYEIQRYNTRGELTAVFGRSVDWLKAPKEMDMGPLGKMMSLDGGSVGGIALLLDDSIVVCLTRVEWIGTYPNGIPQAERTPIYDVFSLTGDWLTTIPGEQLLPDVRIGPWTIADDGAFWCVVWGEFDRVARVPLTVRTRVGKR